MSICIVFGRAMTEGRQTERRSGERAVAQAAWRTGSNVILTNDPNLPKYFGVIL